MIELLTDLPTDLPPHVVGFRAHGEVHADDYRAVLEPAVDAALAGGAKVSLLYVLDDDTTYSAGADWQDAVLGVEHLRQWERIAVVTDAEWCRRMVHLFGWTMPGRIRLFGAGDRAQALAWLTSAE
jgi:hypothetical protein